MAFAHSPHPPKPSVSGAGGETVDGKPIVVGEYETG